MFGMGGSEIIVILIVALLFLGPDKLPQAAKQISKGIRDIKKQSRSLQHQIESDEHIGGAIRDLKSALRGDEVPVRPKTIKAKKPKPLPAAEAATIAGATAEAEPPTVAALVEASGHKPLLATEVGGAAPEPAANVETEADVEADVEAEPEAKPAVTLSPTAGEPDPDVPEPSADEDEELASLIRPAAGTIAKGSEPTHG